MEVYNKISKKNKSLENSLSSYIQSESNNDSSYINNNISDSNNVDNINKTNNHTKTINNTEKTNNNNKINNKDNDLPVDKKVINNLEKLLLNLKIIANLKEYDKLSTSDKNVLIIDSPSLFQGIYRTFYGDSRDETLNKIESIINEIFSITDNLLEKSQNNNSYFNKNFDDDISTTFQSIVLNLSESVKGLQNLKITYLKDVSITSRIDLIINKIQNRITKIVQLLQIVLKED